MWPVIVLLRFFFIPEAGTPCDRSPERNVTDRSLPVFSFGAESVRGSALRQSDVSHYCSPLSSSLDAVGQTYYDHWAIINVSVRFWLWLISAGFLV